MDALLVVLVQEKVDLPPVTGAVGVLAAVATVGAVAVLAFRRRR